VPLGYFAWTLPRRADAGAAATGTLLS